MALSEEPLIQIVYLSNAAEPLDKEELRRILSVAHARNTLNDITGMLVYHGGNFMQVLEGPERAVAQTMERIGRDPRHTGLLVLLERMVDEREFGDWSMAFRGIGDLEGVSPEVASPFLDEIDWVESPGPRPDLAHRLLIGFRERLR